MQMTDATLLNVPLAMGGFALFVAVISLCRCMYDQEFYRLAAMKKVWGRKRGLALHFIAHVGVPLLCGIIFFTQGVTGFANRNRTDVAASAPAYASFVAVESSRDSVLVASASNAGYRLWHEYDIPP